MQNESQALIELAHEISALRKENTELKAQLEEANAVKNCYFEKWHDLLVKFEPEKAKEVPF